jgi:dTDP-4-dehydrorhamnose 3,5-epimerase
LRGLHFQVPPFAQAKLVRVVRGAIFDVAVDIRTGSPNFGRWVGITVSRDSWNQVLVPVGFAHGFVTLEPDTEVCYKATQIYSPAHERSIRYDDPAIGIAWPSIGATINLSPKDAAAPMLAEIETGFVYQ